MTTHVISKERIKAVALLVGVVLIVAFITRNQMVTPSETPSTLSSEQLPRSEGVVDVTATQNVVVQGRVVCLVRKDGAAVAQDDCVEGVSAAGGFLYAVDISKLPAGVASGYTRGAVVSIEGPFTPVESIQSKAWNEYDIKGLFTAVTLSVAP